MDMGQGEAVADTIGIRWRGRPAWLLARSYHLWMMPGVKRKLRLLVDWNVQLLFGRDLSELGQLGHPAGRRAAARRRLMLHDAHGWWIAEAGPPPALPPLAEDAEADVVVIGGGFTGLWTAWHVLEDDHAGATAASSSP